MRIIDNRTSAGGGSAGTAAGVVRLAIATPNDDELLARFVSDGDETVAVFVIVVPAPSTTFTTRRNCAEPPAGSDGSEQVTVPALSGAGVEQANEGPVFCVKEAKLVPDGRTSFHTTVNAGREPLLATRMVYVIVPPRPAGSVGPVLVIERSGEVTCTAAVDVLLAGLGSEMDATVAVLVIVVPALAVTFTTRVNCAEPALIVARVQLMVPVLPEAGAEQVNEGPVFCVNDANVVPDGSTSVQATFCAETALLFVTVMV